MAMYFYTSPRTITVFGEGIEMSAPTHWEVRLEIITTDLEVTKAQEENAKKASQVIDSLLAIGLPRENIQTSAYTIFPRYDYVDGRQIFRGYDITNGLTIRITDLQQVGRVIDTAIKNGANQVSSLQPQVERSSAAYQKALNMAVFDAFSKANSIGKAMQLSTQPQPIEIIESAAPSPVRPFEVTTLKSSEGTPIEPGQSILKAAVTVKFQF